MPLLTSYPKQTVGKSDLTVSRVCLGCMGMSGVWDANAVGPENIKKAIAAFEASLEAGINFFDHADIYGATSCESIFKECLDAVPGIRSEIVIATKCGILSGRFNLSAEYIEESVVGSLKRIGTDYIDIYQMHRPDMLAHPRETAKALRKLINQGLIRNVGVSNYFPEQIRALQTYLEEVPIISNQIQISLERLAPFYEGFKTNHETMDNGLIGDGILDQSMALDITPLAYSPLAKGGLARSKDADSSDPRSAIHQATWTELTRLAEKYGATPGQISLAFLLAHPSGIVPVVGSNNPAHIKEAAQSVNIQLERIDWYSLFMAAWGRTLP